MNTLSSGKIKADVLVIGPDEMLPLFALKYITTIYKKKELRYIILVGENTDALQFLSSYIQDNETVRDGILSVETLPTGLTLAVTGISLFNEHFDVIKKYNGKTHFFIPSLGIFKATLDKQFRHITFIESTFTDYVKVYYGQNIQANQLELTEKKDFINRDIEKSQLRDFIQRNEYRAAKIVGIPGIGKRSILNVLRSDTNFSGFIIEFHFVDEYDTLNDVLSFLFTKLNLDVNLNDNDSYHTADARTKALMRKFFIEFDKLDAASIFFYNIHHVYDSKSNSFRKKEIAIFINELILRRTYIKNKIYFVSDVNFQIDAECDFKTYTMVLGKLSIDHVKLILKNEFSKGLLAGLSDDVEKLDDTKLMNICDGHPQITRLLAKVSENFGLNSILDDVDLTKLFINEHKVKFFLTKLKLDEEEINILTLIALFTEEISIDFLKGKLSNLSLIEQMLNKFILERVVYKNGTVRYYVPTLIKDVVLSGIAQSQIEANHDKIADYYWNKSEEQLSDLIDGYRKAFHHYTASNNQYKINLLTLRFKYKAIDRAFELIKRKIFKPAWALLDHLYQKNQLETGQHLWLYLHAEFYSGKKSSEFLDKLEIAIGLHPQYLKLNLLKANYFLKVNKLKEAKEICEQIAENRLPNDNYLLNYLYVNILFKMDHPDALGFNEKLINKLKKQSHIKIAKKLSKLLLLVIEYKYSKLPNVDSVIRDVIRSLEGIYGIQEEIYNVIESDTQYTDEIIFKFKALSRGNGQDTVEVAYKNKKQFISTTLNEEANSLNVEGQNNDKSEKMIEISKNRYKYMRNKMSYFAKNGFSDIYSIKNYLQKLSESVLELKSSSDEAYNLSPLNTQIIFQDILLLNYLEYLENLGKIVELSTDPERKMTYLKGQRNNIVYLEGETDEMYLRKAAKILQRNHLNVTYCWIGHLDKKGNTSFSGDTALNHAYNYFISNEDNLKHNGKIILLYDSDTKKSDSNTGKVYIRCMKNNPKNIQFKIGIENLLTLPLDFNFNRFYVESRKQDDYGAISILNKLDKTALCNYICNDLEIKDQIKVFVQFKDIFNDIELIINN